MGIGWPMGTCTYQVRGLMGRTRVSGERPIGATSFRQQPTGVMPYTPPNLPRLVKKLLWVGGGKVLQGPQAYFLDMLQGPFRCFSAQSAAEQE